MDLKYTVLVDFLAQRDHRAIYDRFNRTIGFNNLDQIRQAISLISGYTLRKAHGGAIWDYEIVPKRFDGKNILEAARIYKRR